MPTELADVRYANTKVGAVYWDAARGLAVFQYTPEFRATGIQLAPLHMPLRAAPFEFPHLHESFAGLPGLLADCLPDTYGHTLIDEWLHSQGRTPSSFSPVERLCYIGNRGMGALEFRPSLRPKTAKAEAVAIDRLVELASLALARKAGLASELTDLADLNDILRVGTSAGGARAKAVIAWNPQTNEVRSGQADVPTGFEHWLLKFDGVTAAFDGVRDPQGYGRIEYAYSRMAAAAGITMMPCHLFEEGGRAHFMTRRFDRPAPHQKLHCASLFGLAHLSYAAPGSHRHSYEAYFAAIDELDLGPAAKLEAFRRMVFNVLACNRDDHTKNFGFLLTAEHQWTLAPAYDVSYAHNPQPGKWTAQQQLSVLGKRTEITRADLIQLGRQCSVATAPKLQAVCDQIVDTIDAWPTWASEAGIPDRQTAQIQTALTHQRSLN